MWFSDNPKMDKRYQVFVSSTFADLKDERVRVIQTLMEMDCIPAGMELFPAIDEEQFAFIKRVIDDCDYYIVIVGGRYGTTDATGVSYTEKEYEYALERGLKVMAFLHSEPDEIPFSKSEGEPSLRARLAAFRGRLLENRLVKFWTKADDLPGLVALSLSKTIKTYPAVGWVRADHTPREELLEELAALRRQNDKLKKEVSHARTSTSPVVPNIATLDDVTKVTGTLKVYPHHRSSGITQEWAVEVTWGKLFALVSPFLMDSLTESGVEKRLAEDLLKLTGQEGSLVSIDDQVFQTIKVQLIALQLVTAYPAKSVGGTQHTYWSLTPVGKKLMIESRVVRKGEGTR